MKEKLIRIYNITNKMTKVLSAIFTIKGCHSVELYNIQHHYLYPLLFSNCCSDYYGLQLEG